MSWLDRDGSSSQDRAALAAWHEDRLALGMAPDPSTVVRFERKQWCRMPDADPTKSGSAAFMACLWLINRIRPGTFADPDKLWKDDAGYGYEEYPDFRVIHPPREGGDRAIKVVALRAEDATLLTVVADWVNSHSYYGDQP